MPRSYSVRSAAVQSFLNAVHDYSKNPSGHSPLPLNEADAYYARRFFQDPPANEDAPRHSGGVSVYLGDPDDTEGYRSMADMVSEVIGERDLTSYHSAAGLKQSLAAFVNRAKEAANEASYTNVTGLKNELRDLRYAVLDTVAESARQMMTYPDYADEIEAGQLAAANGGRVKSRGFAATAVGGMKGAAKSVGEYLAIHTAALMDMLFTEDTTLEYDTAVRRARITAQNDFRLGPTPG